MLRDLQQLTTLRFFAAMAVVLFNFWPSLGLPMPALLAKGYLGVELFFILSGFILCHVYLQRFGEGGFDYGAFLWARLSRLYPLHIVTLVGLGLLAGAAAALGLHAGDKLLVWPSLGANLLLIHAWGVVRSPGWNHPSWSISAEWFAYLAFPAFACLAWRLRHRPLTAVALASALVVGLQEEFGRLAGFPLTQATVAWGALRVVPCFALGCAVNLLWRARPPRGERQACALALGSLFAGAIGVGLHAPDWAPVIAFGGLIFGLAGLSSAGSRRLTAPALVYLGEVSFSVYMVFIPWQLVVENGAHKVAHLPTGPLPLGLWLFMLAGVVPAAMALHHLVERPAQAALRRRGPPFKRGPRPEAQPLSALAFQS